MRIILNGFILIWLCLLAGCQDEAPSTELPPEIPREIEDDGAGNGLAGLPGPVYLTQSDSAIHWQPWAVESFEKAEQSQHLIFAVIVMPQQPTFEKVLGELTGNREVVAAINENYVPILIDADAMREMSLLTIELCAEIRSGFKLPLMVWMTPKGAPVAWVPAAGDDILSFSDLFLQSHEVLSRMWEEENAYVGTNSDTDDRLRKERLLGRLRLNDKVGDPASISRRCLRQLVSLYDPISRTLDETGDLFPTASLSLLAAGVQTEALPESLREMSREVLVSLLDELLRSAMFDGLDGGVFESRRGVDWSIPSFSRTCSGQARVAVSLFESFAATGDKRMLASGLRLLQYADENYRTEEGLYVFGRCNANTTESWLWEFGEIRDLLSDEELPVFWIAAGLAENGNILSENDPEKKFFRMNSLRNTKDTREVAAVLGLEKEEVSAILESARAKLLKAREKRFGAVAAETDANAGATLRMVSALATAFRVTGDPAYKDRAEKLLVRTKEKFSDGRLLRLYGGNAPDTAVGGRAFLYALAIQASLDVYAVTLDETWKFWAADLMSTATELFVKDGYLREVAAEMDLLDLPLSNGTMVFEESSLGLFTMGLNRLSKLDVPLPQTLRDTVRKYPEAISSNPILHADLAEAALLEGYGKTYFVGEDVSEELKKAVLRLPLRAVTRKICTEEPHKLRVLDAEGNFTEVKGIDDITLPFLP